MEQIVEKNKCTGCTACFNICPKHAIEMIEEDGFKYPSIDQKKCINCGLCKKTCPVINTNYNESINTAYVGYAIDDIYTNFSSSGGIFPIVAEYILNNNGIVIGAAFDKDKKLNHIAIFKQKDLYKLKGSKYLQSSLKGTYTFIKNNLKNNKILFSGTPCQVAGLKSYIKNDYNNLFCIDFVCHGVPSPKLFQKYIEELENKLGEKIENYNFRDKSTGWDTYSNTIIFKNNKISELHSKNKYMKLFLSNIALRESCYNCNFKLGNKYSDITLGDFWGVKKYYPEMYNKKGVSAIIINTDKGVFLFYEIKDKLKYKNCDLNEIILGNPSLKKSAFLPNDRDAFFKDIDILNIDELVNKYVPKISSKKRTIAKIKNIIKKILIIKKM